MEGSPLTDWILVLVPLVLLGGAGLAIFLTLRGQKNATLRAQARQAEFVERQKRAVWAGATVVSARTAALGEHSAALASATLRLQVQPPGGEPYLATTTWLVELPVLAGLQSGAQLSVKIDPEDPQTIYPNMGGAKYLFQETK